jgi:hypothetical protein
MVTLNRLIKSTFLLIRLLIFFFAKMSDTDGKVKDVSQKNVIYDFFRLSRKEKKKNDFLSNNHKRRLLRQV